MAAGKTPVTVKIRSGWDNSHITFREAGLAAFEAGAKAVTLHGRTKVQCYEGKANWEYLKELVEILKDKIPVFGSGDAFSPEDAKRMIIETGCTGVMFARGAMGNPFIFTQTKELLLTGEYSDIPVEKRLDTGMKELNHLIKLKGEYVACKEMRKRFCCYSKGVRLSPTSICCSARGTLSARYGAGCLRIVASVSWHRSVASCRYNASRCSLR